MSKVFIEESTLTAIGNSIRGKTGKTELLNPTNMPAEIDSIQSSSGLPAEGFILTGDCSYMFQYGRWDWFVNMYGNITKTKDITSTYQMFTSSSLQIIPFDINFEQSSNNNENHNITDMFAQCYKLLELPKMNYVRPNNTRGLFKSCFKLRYIPDDFDSN